MTTIESLPLSNKEKAILKHPREKYQEKSKLNNCWSRVTLELVEIVVLFKLRASIVFLLLISGFHGLLLFNDGLPFVSNGLPRASRMEDGYGFLHFIPLSFSKPGEARFKQWEARRETKEARGSPA